MNLGSCHHLLEETWYKLYLCYDYHKNKRMDVTSP